MSIVGDDSKGFPVNRQLVLNTDARGFLFELLRRDNPDFTQFGQVYVIGDTNKGVIRAWHRHFQMDEWFCCVNGEALFVLYDPRKNEFDEYYLTSSQPSLLFVPRLLFHGHQAMKENTIIIAICTEPYYKGKIDEERVAFDYFPEYHWRDDIK